jgi:hypothetical protein
LEQSPDEANQRGRDLEAFKSDYARSKEGMLK